MPHLDAKHIVFRSYVWQEKVLHRMLAPGLLGLRSRTGFRHTDSEFGDPQMLAPAHPRDSPVPWAARRQKTNRQHVPKLINGCRGPVSLTVRAGLRSAAPNSLSAMRIPGSGEEIQVHPEEVSLQECNGLALCH